MQRNLHPNKQRMLPRTPRLLALLLLNLRSSLAFQSCPIQQQARHVSTLRQQPEFSEDISNDNESDEFISSVLYEGTFQEVDAGLLTYLRDGGNTMPPKTRRLIGQITSEYVYGVEGRPNFDSRGILEILDSEYETLPVSMNVGNKTFGPQEGDLLAVQIASLGVLYGLPAEILLRIVDCAGESPALTGLRSEFESWEKVSFPSGLGLRIKQGLSTRTSHPSDQSFFPPSRLPWRSRSSRRAAEAAQRGIELAAKVEAPEQTIMTKEEFLLEIENEIHATPLSEVAVTDEPADGFLSGDTLVLGDALPSFPAQRAWTKVKRSIMNASYPLANNRAWKTFSAVWDTQYNKLKDAGRAGLMAYVFMNFCLYTLGMTWQWRRLAVEISAPAGSTLCSLIIRKFARVFTRVYVGAAVFKLVRIAASLAMAPAADRVLRFTQRKLNVSENAAFIILVTLLLKTFFGTLAIVCRGDSALRQALRSPLEPAVV